MLPVVDGDRLVGLVSSRDFLREFSYGEMPGSREPVSSLLTATPPVELKNEIVTESEATYSDLPPGPVKVTVASRNSKGGESAPCDPVSATVP